MKIILCIFIILTFTYFTFAQTCAVTKQAPFKCPTCTTCTGPSTTCCDATRDAIAAAFVKFVQLKNAPEGCVDLAKEQNCAVCDPKNQGLATDINGIVMCKSKCLTMQKACSGYLNYNCDNSPDTNCWSGANQMRFMHHSKLLLVIVLCVTLLFIYV